MWREPAYPDPNSISYPRLLENAILGSAALVLAWSSYAAESGWVERHLLLAQRLRKKVFPIVLDGTNLPNIWVGDAVLLDQVPGADIALSLIEQPAFPSSVSTDTLIVLSEKAAHEFIRVREEAIEQAADILRRDDPHDAPLREAVLEVLEYLVRNDSMMRVREKAQKVLDVSTNSHYPPDSRHVFRVRCKNGHVSSYDKRVVCNAYRDVRRELRARGGKEVDELHLTCAECGCCVVVRVDCEGYK